MQVVVSVSAVKEEKSEERRSLASAATATIFQPGSVPTCHVDGNGHTVVHFDSALHPSFHCSHNAASALLHRPG